MMYHQHTALLYSKHIICRQDPSWRTSTDAQSAPCDAATIFTV